MITILRSYDDADLNVQCDVFEEELGADCEAVEELREANNVNITDPEALFRTVHNRVCIIDNIR